MLFAVNGFSQIFSQILYKYSVYKKIIFLKFMAKKKSLKKDNTCPNYLNNRLEISHRLISRKILAFIDRLLELFFFVEHQQTLKSNKGNGMLKSK
jgi:hypothetical protein